MYNPSTTVEAFFEGAQNVYEDAPVNFASKKIVIREIGTAKQTDPGNDATAGAFSNFPGEIYPGASGAHSREKPLCRVLTFSIGQNTVGHRAEKSCPGAKRKGFDKITAIQHN